MTTGQARKAFLNAVCPLNKALIAWTEAESAPDANWPTVQLLVTRSADMQLRAARKLGHPKRPWPANIRAYIPVYTEIDLTSAGANYTLARAASLEEYRGLLKSLTYDPPAGVLAQSEALAAARPIVYGRLGLPQEGACDGR
jgi:hypothetical protein